MYFCELKIAKMVHVSSWCVMFLLDIVTGALTNAPSVGEMFRQCLVSQRSPSLGHCLGVQAISKLQSLDSDQQFDIVDGITLSRDEKEFREPYNFADNDPSDLRGLLDSVDHVFSQRSMQWDLNYLYPGLFMKVSPSGHPGGVLEFALDQHRESLNTLTVKEASTGQLLARQFLVPFLLGFKFNLTTLLPILFGLIALVAKKAIILSKIALILSSAYGLGSLLFGTGAYLNKIPTTTFQTQEHFNPSFGGHYKIHDDHEYQQIYYRGVTGNGHTDDGFRVYSNPPQASHAVYDGEPEAKGRNFAWDEDEKKQKSKEKF